MKVVTRSFELPCSPEKFWQVFLDPEYARALYLDELRFKSFTVLELSESARKVRIVPRINLPGPLAKLVGDGFAYEEHGTLDRAASVWTWRMVQPAGVGGKPKIATHGTVTAEALGDGCLRTDRAHIEASVFGLSGLIESTVESEIVASWGKEIPFFHRWLKTH
jgi:hypothetical protein